MGRLTFQKMTWHRCLARRLLSLSSTNKSPEKTTTMKTSFNSRSRQSLTLGDLVLAVSSVSRNTNETAAAVADLLESGRVLLTNNGRSVRARVA